MAVRMPLKGRPVESAAVHAPAFVGREREVAVVRRALASVPALVLVEGEAGIGKSRLVREVLATEPAGRPTALVATCPPYRSAPSLGPIVDALRRARPSVAGLRLSALAGVFRPLLPEWAADLPPALEPVTDPTVARHRLFRALVELLGALDVGLLVVDDAHWADDATLEFLLSLSSGRHDLPLGLVVTYRPEEVASGSLLRRLTARPPAGGRLERVTLTALDVAGTASVVSSMLDGQPLSDAFATFMHEATGGVPLAVEESVRLMVERADLIRQDGEWMRRELGELHVPPTVRDSVLERLDRLSPDAARAVRAAAVLVAAEDGTVCQVAGLAGPPAGEALAEAVSRGLLVEDEPGRLGFRHALVRKAVYEAIPGPERRRLHQRAGEALERLAASPVTQLVRHFREAGETGKWCRYAEQAAEAAIAANDYPAAAGLLHDVLAGADPAAADEVRLTRRLAEITLYHRDVRLERDVLERLQRLLATNRLEPAEEGTIRGRIGGLLVRLREYEAGRAELAKAVPLLLATKPVEAARALAVLGWPLGRVPAREHLKWLRRAADIDLADLPPTDRLALLSNRGSALVLLGEPAGWSLLAQLPATAPTLQERLYLAIGLMNAGVYGLAWGRYQESGRRLADSLRLAEADQFTWMVGCILAGQAHLDWFTGNWAGLADRVAELAGQDSVHPDARLEAREIGALLKAATGPPEAATEQLRKVVAEVQDREVFDTPTTATAGLARLRLAAGDVTEALRLTDEEVRLAERTGRWLQVAESIPVRVRALVGAGQPDDAGRLVSAYARALKGRDAPAPRAGLALCRAILREAADGPERAADAFGRAAAAWQRLPRPYDALLAREDQGRCLLAAGRREAGVDRLTAAFQELSRLGARHDAQRVQQRLREHGVAVRREWRRGRRGYGNQLSPRELEVVRLVAAGRTNREIASALSRSPSTVALQLHSAMRKLGAATRTAAAVAAIEAGLLADERAAADR